MSRTRLVAAAALLSLCLALVGVAWDAARFGWNPADSQAHLQRELARRVADRARMVETTAVRLSRSADLVAAAARSRDRLPELFDRLRDPVAAGLDAVAATIWVPVTPASDYRALAWTDGAAEDLTAADLNRAPGLIVAAGAGGLRLVSVQPIERDGTRLGVTAAETPLSIPSTAGTFAPGFAMASTVGPVQIEAASGTSVADGPGQFTIHSPAGTPLVTIRVAPDQIAQSRRAFRWRAAGVALIPWAVCLVVWLSGLTARRRRSGTSLEAVAWSSLITLGIAAGAAGAAWMARQGGLPAMWGGLFAPAAALAIAATGPGTAWRRTPSLRRPRRVPVRFLIEHLTGGVVLAAGIAALTWLCRHPLGPSSIAARNTGTFPSSFPTAAELAALLLFEVAVCWATAGILGVVAARWTLSWRRPRAWAAAAMWILPGGLFLMATQSAQTWTGAGTVALAAGAVIFGWGATAMRRQYRHTSEARRLVLQFCALVAPILATYPLAAASVDRATREIIEHDYAPATQAAQQPDALMASLTSVWANIDAITELPDLLREAGTSVNGNQLAFRVWNRTILKQDRVTSQIELYGPTHTLLSHFSLNVPEFGSLAQSSDQPWPGSGCEWYAFADVARFGADERRMLQAERALCGAGGEFLGAVVVRIIPDYRTLPFVTSANPYYDALGSDDAQRRGSRVPELQVAVYGWSLQPLFASGRVIWPIDDELAARLRRSREAFWADRPLEDRVYHLRFLNDRGGIYAVGYPAPTPLQHATRLAESAAILMLMFLGYLAATVALAPLTVARVPPLGRLFVEIRTSFYRKLFLFFVVAAIGPVVLFAIAFGTYMTAKLRVDVESEASSVVLMARRVLDELSAAQAPAGQPRPAPTDLLMVWIRQVIDQDANLFEGPALRATSQRDLFDYGFLPARTPASVYRQIALDRRPVFVVEDRIGAFQYLVAAAPVPALGREAVLTVPLASRQRDIERQIDELTQGVLTGAVVLVLFAAGLGASVAGRVSDPVARLTRATRLIAAGRFDERLAADTADELGRLVRDFNTMTQMLVAQRDELARANQLKAWADMARQVAHEIKNPLTPIQLAAEHLQRVHEDAKRPLGPIVDQCLSTILKQVRLLRRIASEFSTFAGTPTPRIERIDLAALVDGVVDPYRAALPAGTRITVEAAPNLPAIRSDRTLLARALTNLVENAIQAMPDGGLMRLTARSAGKAVEIRVIDTGVGMDEDGVRRAFEPYFSTKTGGSGLGLANAKRNIELCGGTIDLASRRGQGTTVTVTLPADPPAGTSSA